MVFCVNDVVDFPSFLPSSADIIKSFSMIPTMKRCRTIKIRDFFQSKMIEYGFYAVCGPVMD